MLTTSELLLLPGIAYSLKSEILTDATMPVPAGSVVMPVCSACTVAGNPALMLIWSPQSCPVRVSADATTLFFCRKFYVGGGSNADDFYTLASARQAYKNHLKVVTSRKNTINGKVRGDSLVTYSLLELCESCPSGSSFC